MNVPDELNDWEAAMSGNPGSQQVLQHFKDERCLDGAVESDFWDGLRDNPKPGNASEAWQQGKQAVWKDPTLSCKGREIPGWHFEGMTRYSLPEKLPVIFPDLDLAASGLSEADLRTAPVADLEPLIDEAMVSRRMKLDYPTWVAEASDELESAKVTPPDLLNRLGLPDHHQRLHAEGLPCVGIHYPRAASAAGATLHVPTSLDGVACEPFRPNPDCTAPHGLTEPLTSGAGGGLRPASRSEVSPPGPPPCPASLPLR